MSRLTSLQAKASTASEAVRGLRPDQCDFGRLVHESAGARTSVVARKLWKFPGGALWACEGSVSQAARSGCIGSRGWERISQPSTLRIRIWPDPVPARFVHHAHPGLEGFRNDPRLHLVRPRPPAHGLRHHLKPFDSARAPGQQKMRTFLQRSHPVHRPIKTEWIKQGSPPKGRVPSRRLRKFWWRHVEPRQGMWRALAGRSHFVATPSCKLTSRDGRLGRRKSGDDAGVVCGISRMK